MKDIHRHSQTFPWLHRHSQDFTNIFRHSHTFPWLHRHSHDYIDILRISQTFTYISGWSDLLWYQMIHPYVYFSPNPTTKKTGFFWQQHFNLKMWFFFIISKFGHFRGFSKFCLCRIFPLMQLQLGIWVLIFSRDMLRPAFFHSHWPIWSLCKFF